MTNSRSEALQTWVDAAESIEERCGRILDKLAYEAGIVAIDPPVLSSFPREIAIRAMLAFTEPAAAMPGVPARELLAAAIQQADDAFGYNMTLTRLVDGEATYTLTMPGFDAMEVSEMDEGYAIIAERRNKCRADAILALIPSHSGETGEVERLREALATRDRKVSECPDAKLDPDKECRRCGAMSNEGCRVTALADAGFVHNARIALATPNDGGRDDAN